MCCSDYLTLTTVVAIDLETTGRGKFESDERWDGITQIGLTWRDWTDKLCTWTTDCNPGEIHFEGSRANQAFAVNRFTKERIRKAPPVEDAIKSLRNKLAEIGDHSLIAYNLPFEQYFLGKVGFEVDNWMPCLMIQAMHKLNSRVPLLTSAKAFGISINEECLHDASEDTRISLLVYEAITLGHSGRPVYAPGFKNCKSCPRRMRRGIYDTCYNCNMIKRHRQFPY